MKPRWVRRDHLAGDWKCWTVGDYDRACWIQATLFDRESSLGRRLIVRVQLLRFATFEVNIGGPSVWKADR